MHPEAANGLRLVGHSDLGGYGDGMQLMRSGDALYVGHFGPSGMGTTILDVSDVRRPTVVRQWAAPAHSHTNPNSVTHQRASHRPANGYDPTGHRYTDAHAHR